MIIIYGIMIQNPTLNIVQFQHHVHQIITIYNNINILYQIHTNALIKNANMSMEINIHIIKKIKQFVLSILSAEIIYISILTNIMINKINIVQKDVIIISGIIIQKYHKFQEIKYAIQKKQNALQQSQQEKTMIMSMI